VILITLTSCNEKNNQIKNNTTKISYSDLSDSIIYNRIIKRGYELTIDDSISSMDTIYIDTTCVIFIGPSNRQLKFMRSGDESDEIAVEDNAYYLSNAKSYFRENNIKVISSNSTFVAFRKCNIVLNTKKYLDYGWVELGYKYGKNPLAIDIVGIDSISLLYFQ